MPGSNRVCTLHGFLTSEFSKGNKFRFVQSKVLFKGAGSSFYSQ